MVRVLILILFALPLFPTSHSAGLSFSSFSGMGFNYNYRYSKLVNIDLTGFPAIVQSSNDKTDDKIFNLGTLIRYNFLKKDGYDIYLGLGGSFWYVERSIIETEVINSREYTNRVYDINRIIHYGVVTGIRYSLSKKFKIDLNVGIQQQHSDSYNIGILIDRDQRGTSYLGLAGGFSLNYKF